MSMRYHVRSLKLDESLKLCRERNLGTPPNILLLSCLYISRPPPYRWLAHFHRTAGSLAPNVCRRRTLLIKNMTCLKSSWQPLELEVGSCSHHLSTASGHGRVLSAVSFDIANFNTLSLLVEMCRESPL